MKKTRCLVIPAIKKNAVIPDQLVKKLAGTTLIQRALNTAAHIVPPKDIYLVTDSDEIRLIGTRNGVQSLYDPAFYISSLNIMHSLKQQLQELAEHYEHIIIYRPSAPLITPPDIEDAYAHFVQSQSHCLVTVKNVRHRLWQERGNTLDALLFNDEGENAYIETKALFMLNAHILTGEHPPQSLTTTPYFLNDRSVEINSYQDWWICEKILQSKHIVFVVAGYAEIGMGHIYRALMLAHEIADHRITFLCTSKSELGARSIAAKDYRTRMQQSDDLAEEVLHLRPDMVINDILDTSDEYMQALQSFNIPLVNFEDTGKGAELADFVVNALYPPTKGHNPKKAYGPKYFCLRDEFLHAEQNTFRPVPKRVLVTFGGTDPSDYTRKTLDTLLPYCVQHALHIALVAGPGYAHVDSLLEHVHTLQQHLPKGLLTFTHQTNIMSQEMESVDFAIASAGRTVFELAHMRIPAIILSQHEREASHTFARPENGFLFIPGNGTFCADTLTQAFEQMLNQVQRKKLHDLLCTFDFTQNKHRVVQRILQLLPKNSR